MGLFSRGSDSDDDTTGESTSPFEGRGFVAAAIVVGALAVCVLVWLVSRDSGQTPATQPSVTLGTTAPTEQPTDGPTRPPATPDNPTGTPSVRPPAGDPTGGCKAKNVDQRMPRVAPPAVTWTFESDMLIPAQQQGGPARLDPDGLRSCFAHSPTGAVLAAMVTLGQWRNPDLTEAVTRRLVLPGPGRTRALAAVKSSPTPRNSSNPSQFTGFKIIDYQPNRAIISIAVRLDARGVGSLPVTMSWFGGDWKLALRPDGTINGDVDPDVLQSLDGYVRFGGA